MNSLDSFNKVIVCLAFHDAETGVLNEITKIGRNIADNVNMDFMDYVRQVVKSGPADETLLNDAKQNVEKPLMGIFAQYNMVLKRINQISAGNIYTVPDKIIPYINLPPIFKHTKNFEFFFGQYFRCQPVFTKIIHQFVAQP